MRMQTLLVCAAVTMFGALCGAQSGPLLIPDYDRDGVIGVADGERAQAHERLVFWLNDDDDDEGTDGGANAGDANTDLHDVPGGEGNDKDCEDRVVNGRCDLLDFFPVLIDVNGVDEWGDYTWELSSKSVNVVFTGLSAGNAGSFHTMDVKWIDGDTSLYKAEVERLAGEGGKEVVALPERFLQDGRGVILIEGAALGDEGLTLRGMRYGSDPAVVTLKLDVKNVEDMYGWMNLRPKAKEVKDEGEGEQWKVENSSVRLPTTTSTTTTTDGRHFILVHGYNTNHEEARGNAAEFYKKLWQSGCDAKFTAVEWQGDQSQKELFGVTFTPNYFVNVENAFLAARPFADACKKLPGEKILVGHSLGNLVIASAIKDYGLDYMKFVMLNAAVAREAFDENAYDEDMVDEDWIDEKGKVRGGGVDVGVGGGVGEDVGGDDLTNHLDRAARWYRNFAGKEYDPYEYRRKLAWRGRFANLPRTVNFYSQTDNVLLNPDPHEEDPDQWEVDDVWDNFCMKVVRTPGRKTGFGFWAFSEKMKGTWIIDVLNEAMTKFLDVKESDHMKCEAGWGENPDYDDEITEFVPANTRFKPFLDERLKTPGMLDILPAETERVRAQHLGDAIPVESFAAGANPVATLENVDMTGFIGENPDWPVFEGDSEHKTNEWWHSSFREVAFYHTSKLYASLAAVERQRVIVDTDLGSSMDDLFTIDLAARMHKAGKLNLMAVMMNRPDRSDPEREGEFLTFADRYLASLGFGDLPLGTSKPLPADAPRVKVFNPYWTLIHSNNLTGVGALMPTNRTVEQLVALTNAVSLYRRLLNDAPDKSVVICSTGFLTNLKELLESCQNYEGDNIASTGLELIAAKVKELRIMGGCFDPESAPDGTYGAEYNFAGDPDAAKKVVEEWPTPVILSPWEVGFKLYYKSGDVLADFPLGTFDPVVRAAYTYWPDPGPDAMNRLWDPMTVLPLTEGETLVPLSVKGGISVDEDTGVTTFVPDPSSNRCYQVASNMNETAVLNRLREIYRTGNPSVSLLVSGQPEPGVDYNGSELVFKFENISLGNYAEGDLKFNFALGGAEYAPESSSWDERLGVLDVRFVIPPDAVTAGNVYNGTLAVTLENETLGSAQLTTATRQLVQGAVDQGVPVGWFDEFDLEVPTNYVPAEIEGVGDMPERTTAVVDTTFLFEAASPATDEPPEGTAQAAVRVVEDGEGGYKFQYYAFVGKEGGYYYRGWHDFNVGGENVHEMKPVIGQTYVVRMEGFYYEDARGEANTLAIFVAEEGSNEGFVKQFVGNLVNQAGGLGGRTRLNSVELAGEGTIYELKGDYCLNVVNANLAKIDYEGEYATVAEAIEAANGQPVRLLYAASWKPTAADIGKSIRFLNKSWLNPDLSGLPANARIVWTDVDGNNGTLTLELVLADTVVYGTIRTAEKGNPVAEAIAIKDGKYVYVGDETGAAAFIEDGVTAIIDHRGKGMVMPGCTDGHSHYIMKFGLANMKGGVLFDLRDDKTNVLRKVEEAAGVAQAAGKTCIFGFGWNLVALRVDDQLTLAELDKVTHGLSTVIFAQGGHHAYCNSECLKRCGIIDGEGNVLITKIDGGLLELDEKGYPTGFADERVTGYLMRMGGINFDEIVDDEMAEASIRASQGLLLSTGYTMALEGWSNMLHPTKLYEAAHRMDTDGVLKLVFPMSYEVEPWQTNMTEQIDCLDALNRTYGTRHVRPEYLKVFMDGCVESMTGAMIKPYKLVPPYYYNSFWSVDRLADITRACNARGLTVHTHAMGDAAIRDVTDAYVQGGDGTHRNCLVHLRHVREEDFQRFADNNIACSAGFTWHVSSAELDELLEKFLDDEYIKHAYPMKSFFDAGVKVSSHSDFPANEPSPQDPFGIMQVALTGLLPNPAEGEKPFDTDELVTLEQVFQALTINGAWQLGLENERGSIKVGKWADFVLADQDVFECAVTDIGKTKVVSTWFEGEKVYQPVLVTPGTPAGPYETAAAATNAMEFSVICPRDDVAAALGTDAALGAYRKMFGFTVTGGGEAWAVEAALTPMAWSNVVKSAQEATRQIPVADIAALPLNVETNVTVKDCGVPGFFYSFYSGGTVTNLRAVVDKYGRNVLCGTGGEMTFSGVTKPSDAAGFFSIGVKEAPGVDPADPVLFAPIPLVVMPEPVD